MNGTSTASRPEPVERRLPPEAASVAEARTLVRDLLVTAERRDLVDTAVLLVSEVVTNALLHAGTPMEVAAWLDEEGLRVEVADGSEHLPVRRRYGATAGTGRGMLMLERLVHDWGVSRHRDGKTVWFQLTRPGPGDHRTEPHEDDGAPRPATGQVVAVELLYLPLLLHAAWQEHAEALLREYVLVSLDDLSDVNAIQMHADATDAIAILEEQIPRTDVAVEPDQLMRDATEPHVSMARLRIDVPVASVPHFRTLSDAIDASIELARRGRILTPPTQPEIQLFRRWLCDEVLHQAAGRRPVPWSVEREDPEEHHDGLAWNPAAVIEATTGIVAADESDRIIAVSAPALDILGYDDPAELVGRRLLAIIPERFRQAHVAGFTMYLLAGRQPLLGRPVEVPALCRDGSERPVELIVTAEHVGDGRTLFLADLRPL